MPKKLQIKLLSNSGELLNVVNCFAGQLTVFRATTPSDLRPYQRALAGSQGKEKFTILVDGAEYQHDQQTLIGMGETAPHSGLTTAQYFVSLGVPEDSIDALLGSYGLEESRDRKCSALTSDEERRVRLLAATCLPDKVLVVNEPFEPIPSQWKERFAEMLATYVRTRNAIVVVTSLSNRPECWIDNEAVARVQVGDTIQKTIGFGSATSESTVLMNQLRDLLRDESKVQDLLAKQGASPSQQQAATSLGVGAVAFTGDEFEEEFEDAAEATHKSIAERFGFLAPSSPIGAFYFACAGVATIGVAIIGTRLLMDSKDAPLVPTKVASLQTTVKIEKPPQNKTDLSTSTDAQPSDAKRIDPNAGRVIEQPRIQQPPPSRFVLDGYPELIRTSVLDTARGIAGEMPVSTEPVTNAPSKAPSSGNLFKLLESASTNQADKPSDSNPGNTPDNFERPNAGSWSEHQLVPDGEASDEQTRREAIRQKFLEAIRAAAERRQSAMETGQ